MKPAVSVVVTSYNYGRFLAGALESVRRQTLADFECVVVDDGSTDDTAAAAGPFLADPRFRLISTSNLGQPRAKNLGLRLTRGPLVAYLDADDEWLPEKLERQVALFERRPQVGVVFSERSLMGPGGEPRPGRPRPLPRGRVLAQFFRDNYVCFSSSVARRSALEHVGGFDPRWRMAIDYDLWIRVARLYEFDYVDAPLVRYRTGHDNLSRNVLDRIGIAASIKRRFLQRWGFAAGVPAGLIRDARGDACVTASYVTRGRPRESLRWAWRAFRAGRRRQGLRCAAAAVAHWARRT